MDNEPAALDVSRAALPEVIRVVPTIAVKAVGHHRGAEQKLHLAARHPHLHLVDICLLEQVTLLDVDAVYATAEPYTDQYGSRRRDEAVESKAVRHGGEVVESRS